MLAAFDEGGGGAGSFGVYDQSYEHSYDWSHGGGGPGVGRRRWSDAEKLEILAEAFRPGARVCDVIARREVSSSLIYTWRKQLRVGKLAGTAASLPVFAEVRLAEPIVPASPPVPCSSGRIDIALPGGVRISVDGGVDADALARVLSVLR
ncbi:IS66-like element accessory protein TnpA [Sphingomonas sp.]|uniref:IS66-like element accessory protein TnpA n=1 Tax=Sphingomonas sp. TaxID=28214 RepID=UPI002FD87DD7